MIGLTACSDMEPVEEDGSPRATSSPDATADQERVDAVIEGPVVGSDGQPLAGASVLVTSRRSTAQQLTELFGVAATAGLICLAGECFGGDDAFETTTGPDGRYSATLPQAHVPGFELDTDWFVTASEPAPPGRPTGAVASQELEVALAVQSSPDLVLWAPTVDVDADEVRTVVRWPPLDADRFDGDRVEHRLRFLDGAGVPIWTMPPAEGGEAVDSRVLEDARGVLELVARGDITVGPTIYHQTMSAPHVPFTGPAGAPPSRDAPCTIRTVDGTPAAPGPCWLTDGSLTAARPGPPPCPERPAGSAFDDLPDLGDPSECQPAVAEAVVDLGSPTEVDLLVVRRCDRCVVDLSSDGSTWEELGRTTSDAAVVHAGDRGARMVRLRPDERARPVGATEISVWPAVSGGGSQPDEQGRLPDHSGAGGDRDAWWRLVAAAATVAAVAAIVLLVRERRRHWAG